MSKRIFYPAAAIIVLLSLVAAVAAQDKSMTGYIVDKACSARVATKDDVTAAAAAHTKKCALMPNCAGSGFGLYSDGKYYEFDAKGNELAKASLEASTKEKGAQFKVDGSVKDGKLMVTKITEVN
jgi:hypothetical protein